MKTYFILPIVIFFFFFSYEILAQSNTSKSKYIEPRLDKFKDKEVAAKYRMEKKKISLEQKQKKMNTGLQKTENDEIKPHGNNEKEIVPVLKATAAPEIIEKKEKMMKISDTGVEKTLMKEENSKPPELKNKKQ